ncbi:hypothetical protein OE766_05145 [Pararhizobium sp. YC-54]|uniref:hypothetical protein n=1 Tax=Pararhizobium sp. YC-54 TaxID=2986920 RepID=UPI0021F725F2|nr:hypothetical protein [Pararhizobium sp. YC-54]MCV9997624.1 hypothetical protein [Pararhizobium sp. YC-54]
MERQTSACRMRAVRLSALLLAGLFASSVLLPHSALALSELKQIPGETSQDKQAEDVPEEDEPGDEGPMQIPMPDPLVNKPAHDAKDASADDKAPAAPVEVLSDVSKIPEPVARMRELIVEAAASGDIERLRPLLGKGPTQTQVGETDADPVETLKGLSGDPQGIEIMAILLDVLSTGFVLSEKGTPDEAYVWPYFTEKSLASLTPPEKVDLFRLVTAGDFAEMEEGGNYNFYRVGITPDGQWKFFVAGD